MTPDRYVARICWNSQRWVRPTGEAAKAEAGTYAARMGFGHEEWLFDWEWMLDGWKYGFLQPVSKSRTKLEGKSIDVRLYTIRPDAQWFYAAHLRSCEVLDEDRAAAARDEFKKRGWYKEMLAHLKQIGGDPDGLKYDEAVWLFNIRYRPKDAVLYDPMVPVEADDGLRMFRRYTLVGLTGAAAKVEQQWISRVGTTELRPTGKQRRAGVAARDVDLVHNRLQNELFELLRSQLGAAAVEMEHDFADVKVRRDGKVLIIEVKSDARPRFAVREALGQLLEYAYHAEQKGEAVAGLVVAGPGELTDSDRAYLEHLRGVRFLPVRYICVRRGMTSVDL